MFEKLCGLMEESQVQLDQFLKDEITEHLQSLEKEVERWISITGTRGLAHDLFKVKSMTKFWCTMYQSYSKVSMVALRVLAPFTSTYLCEAGFSTLVNIKTKNRNRLDVGDDMRLALTNFRP
ncbi:protein FAM200A-like [Oratosquilla oratoria]|uniref:protein FAM200A-like n=1 Tax=Oratosquilla oratoria TaxID=337810 RepID=UPI003F77175B